MIGANSVALMGVGLAGELADVIGADYSLAIGKGTAQVGANIIMSDNVELNVSAGQTAVVQPVGQQIAEPIHLYNSSATATTALVFVPSGHTINGSLNGSLSVPQNKAAILWQYKNKFWTGIVSS